MNLFASQRNYVVTKEWCSEIHICILRSNFWLRWKEFHFNTSNDLLYVFLLICGECEIINIMYLLQILGSRRPHLIAVQLLWRKIKLVIIQHVPSTIMYLTVSRDPHPPLTLSNVIFVVQTI